MNEEEYYEQLCSNSLDGTLTASEKEKLEAHLAECPSCAALKQDLEQMQLWLAADEEIPAELHTDIMKRLEQEQKLKVVRPEKPARRMPVFTMVAAAAVVVLVVLGGGLMPMLSTVGGSAADSVVSTAAGGSEAAVGGGAVVQDVQQAAEDAGLDAGGGAAAGQADAVPQDKAAAPADPEPRIAAPQPEASGGQMPAEPAEEPEAAEPSLYGEKATGQDKMAPQPAAVESAVTVTAPALLHSTAVAHCYVAQGGAGVPDVGGKLVAEADGVSWFLLDNTMTVLQDTFRIVEEAGYTLSAYEGVGLTMDAKAASWLLAVVSA